MKTIWTLFTFLLLMWFVGLFMIPCILVRIAIAGAHIAWLTSNDILGELEAKANYETHSG
jgi:hypothetical protein